jgi:hypothetical protein
MNNKKQLRELVRHIIKGALQELLGSSLSNSFSKDPDPSAFSKQAANMDQSMPPVDSMTNSEKQKYDRDQDAARREAIRASDEELKTSKKEMDFEKQKLDQLKRFKIPNLQTQIQTLKKG